LVKDILVGDDKIVIRHSIPLPTNPSGGDPQKADSPGPSPTQSESYLLRSGRHDASLRSSSWSLVATTLVFVTRFQHLLNEPQHSAVGDLLPDKG
jgi:hypothetical protein